MKSYIDVSSSFLRDDVVAKIISIDKLTRNTFLTLPKEIEGLLIFDEKIISRVESCSNLELLDYIGKDFKNNKIKLFCYRKIISNYVPWGFGNFTFISKKDSKNYIIGFHGTFSVAVSNALIFSKRFNNLNEITIDDIVKAIKPLVIDFIKNEISNNSNLCEWGINDFNSNLKIINDSINKILSSDNKFFDFGIEVSKVSFASLYVNQEMTTELKAEGEDKFYKEELMEIKNQLSSLYSGFLSELNKQKLDLKKDYLSDLNKIKNKVSILNALVDEMLKAKNDNATQSLKNMKDIEDLQKSIESLSNHLNSDSQNNFNSLNTSLNNLKNMFDDLSNKVNESFKGNQSLLNRVKFAKSRSDYQEIASRICSKVEENLIYKFKLNHKKEDFVISEADFYKLNDLFGTQFKPKFMLKENNIEYFRMPSLFRFYLATKSVEASNSINYRRICLNKIRHFSDENYNYVKDVLNELGCEIKEFFISTINLIKENGLLEEEDL